MGWADDYLTNEERNRHAPHPGFNLVCKPAGEALPQRVPVEPCFCCGVKGRDHATSEFACMMWRPAP